VILLQKKNYYILKKNKPIIYNMQGGYIYDNNLKKISRKMKNKYKSKHNNKSKSKNNLAGRKKTTYKKKKFRKHRKRSHASKNRNRYKHKGGTSLNHSEFTNQHHIFAPISQGPHYNPIQGYTTNLNNPPLSDISPVYQCN